MENKNLTTSHVNPDDAERIKNTTSDNCSEVVNAQSTERLSIRPPNTTSSNDKPHSMSTTLKTQLHDHNVESTTGIVKTTEMSSSLRIGLSIGIPVLMVILSFLLLGSKLLMRRKSVKNIITTCHPSNQPESDPHDYASIDDLHEVNKTFNTAANRRSDNTREDASNDNPVIIYVTNPTSIYSTRL